MSLLGHLVVQKELVNHRPGLVVVVASGLVVAYLEVVVDPACRCPQEGTGFAHWGRTGMPSC
jgi:hypothetical protein